MFKPVEEVSAFGGKITKLYYCAAEAAREIGVDYATMLKLIQSGDRFKHHLYRWYYKQNRHVEPNNNIFHVQQLRDDDTPVNRFKSVSEAERILGVGRNIITRWIMNGEKDYWGFHWIRN